MYEVTTTNFADFGWRERRMAAELLTASCEQGFPEHFEDHNVQIMMNRNSGNVFFTNAEGQVAMMNGDKLELWHFLPYHGEEGFAEDFADASKDEFHPDDWDYLVQYGIVEDLEDEEDA